MAAEDPLGPTAEGTLIRRARESFRPRLSAAAAAKKAGISAEMWGHIERGHRSAGKGSGRVRVTPSAGTLAHMADVVGLAPSDLEEVGREDAAKILEQIQERELEVAEFPVDDGVVLVPVPPDLSAEDREVVRRKAEQLAKYLKGLSPDEH
jgi:transcriptional regulator with XRE-family HTH domain